MQVVDQDSWDVSRHALLARAFLLAGRGDNCGRVAGLSIARYRPKDVIRYHSINEKEM
jgi:hypothetical protein